MPVLRKSIWVLALFCAGSAGGTSFRLTVTCDQRQYDAAYDLVLAAMQGNVGGQGAFQVSPGDIDPPANLRARIDNRFGATAIWYPGIGNHEEETPADMDWLRAEYANANGSLVRTPLSDPSRTNHDGPAGTVETTYTWDYGNARFIMLNQYWNGGTAPGSDVATDGDVVPELRNWLAARLAENTKPVVFVFGHEPAFPFNRHVGDSLDQYPANRDAFWNLLESYPSVKAYFTGHTHYYSKYQRPGGRVWQFDAGNAGNDPGDGKTFFDVTVTDTQVKVDVWRDKTGSWAILETITIPVDVPEPTDVATPAEAKLLGDNALIRLSANVSASFPGFFYVEDADSVSGIRVDEPGHDFSAGSGVTVTGELKTSTDGERYIDASQIVAGPPAVTKPLGMVNRSLAGGDWNFDAGTGAGQRGATGAFGLNNVGLLVRVSGTVTASYPDHFYVDDGSDPRGAGVNVLSYCFKSPPAGTRVSFTGVSSCRKRGVDVIYDRLIRACGGLERKPFVSYNDCIWSSGQYIAPHVTTYGIGGGYSGPTSGPLLDYSCGGNTGVTVTLTQSGGVTWQPSTSSGGTDCSSGTDACNTFCGIADMVGVVYYGSTGWWVDAEFSGLAPGKSYEFVTSSNRAGGSTYLDRLTKYTISGADAFTNASSSGTTIGDGGASTTFCTGENTTTGYVARWTGIQPGADGKFKVRAESGSAQYRAYAFDVFKLAEEP